MRLFGFDISRTNKQQQPLPLTAYDPAYGGWFANVRESFAGAWQTGFRTDATRSLLAFSAVYACVSLIANDIGKLRLMLTEDAEDGTQIEVANSPLSPVLDKPNAFQTRIQFMSYWMTSKLLSGNAYVLKERDNRNVVVGMYVLDPNRVTPLVTEDGGVYYRVSGGDLLSGYPEGAIFPASEIMHDRMVTLWHPLIGVTPIYACGMSATQGIRIQKNSATFFENMSRPSGILTAPGKIDNEQADRIKKYFEENASGQNIGRILVFGNGLTYGPLGIAAADSQLIEQQKWTVEDVGRAFHMPLHKIQAPSERSTATIASQDQFYYSQTLQIHVEAIEILLNEGLKIPKGYEIEFDTTGLARLDIASRYESYKSGVGGGWMAPNEARALEGLKPVAGGDSPFMQEQNWPLEALAKRPPPTPAAPNPRPSDSPDAEVPAKPGDKPKPGADGEDVNNPDGAATDGSDKVIDGIFTRIADDFSPVQLRMEQLAAERRA